MSKIYRVLITAPKYPIPITIDFKTKRERGKLLELLNDAKTNSSFKLSEGEADYSDKSNVK